MRKFIATLLSCVIICAVIFAIAVIISTVTGTYSSDGWRYYLIIGVSGAAGGLLGPMIAKYIAGKFSKH